MKILVLNGGSSSQKSSFYSLDRWSFDSRVEPLWSAQLSWSKEGAGELVVNRRDSLAVSAPVAEPRDEAALAHLLGTLFKGDAAIISGPEEVDIVGHRVVHGGHKYMDSVFIDEKVKETMRQLVELAPAHERENLKGVEIAQRVFPGARQLAVFDTAFHRRMPEEAAVYPLPYEWFAELGIRRYGFHGISHSFCAERAAQILGRPLSELKLITCHLGNGCSLTAVKEGRCQMTTMGFTPLAGLMMGKRCGSVDPSILLYLLEHGKYTVGELQEILNQESGLKGVSGLSGDMRAIEQAASQGHERARLAFNMFVLSLKQHIGSLIPLLGGLDALVFAGGIGENSTAVRKEVCQALGFLGVAVDDDKNKHSSFDLDISAEGASVKVLVVHTAEDWAIAGECFRHMA